MSEQHTPTLESMPEVGPFGIKNIPLGSMIHRMQLSRYYGWGFPIYRATYSDEDCWQRYIAEMRQQIQEDLEREDRADLLLPYLRHTIIEDPGMQGATKSEIRRRFTLWADSRSEARDGKGATNPHTEELNPRFRYCLYVDDNCLHGFKAYEAWRDAGSTGRQVYAPCIITDKECKLEGEGREGWPDVEGCTREYTGWMYLSVDCIPGIYNKLSHQKLLDGYYEYARPPLVYPGHRRGLSINS